MKNIVFALALVILGGGFASVSHAQVATSTPAAIGGHRHPLLAGYVDSINGKGAWLLENAQPVFGKISYVVENPTNAEEARVKSVWLVEIAKWLTK